MTTESEEELRASMRSAVIERLHEVLPSLLGQGDAHEWEDASEQSAKRWKGRVVTRVRAQVEREVVRLLVDAWEVE